MTKYIPCGIGRKSTLLLLLILFCLLNTALLFRAAINTLYFLEDAGKDYSAITATVTDLLPTQGTSEESKATITPVFSFVYKGKTMTREAPELRYIQQKVDHPPYKIGDMVSLWIHDYQGKIILPPSLSRKKIGVSQLVVSALSLILAIILWKVRNLLARRKQTCGVSRHN